MRIHTPVVPTQAVYRQLLQAMSHPGRAYPLAAAAWDSPLLAVCATLLDHEVSYAVVPGGDPARERTIFAATKARAAPVEEADYLLVAGPDSGAAAGRAKRGEPTYPDRGATVVYAVGAPVAEVRPLLSGPGIREEAPPECNPLSAAEWALLAETNSEYPLGVDAICLIGADRVLCVPRSTRIGLG